MLNEYFDLQGKPVIEKAQKMSYEAADKALDASLGVLREYGRKTVAKAIDVGKVLIIQKSNFQHGMWLPYLKKKGLSRRTASRYMALAEAAAKWANLAHLECSSVGAAMELLGVPEGSEEQEIPPPDQQADAFAPTNGQPSSEPAAPAAPTPTKPREAVCAACLRDARVGKALPSTCPECKRIETEKGKQWKARKRKQKLKITGGASPYVIACQMNSIVRHALNGAVDRGVPIDPENPPEIVDTIKAKLREVKDLVQAWWKELKPDA
jgi:hypothetical protein